MTNTNDAPEGKRGLPDRPQAREDVVFRRLEDEWVLYDPKGQNMHVLNASAGIIWHNLDGTKNLEELVENTRAAFDPPAPVEVVRDDVVRTLEHFVAEGLLACTLPASTTTGSRNSTAAARS